MNYLALTETGATERTRTRVAPVRLSEATSAAVPRDSTDAETEDKEEEKPQGASDTRTHMLRADMCMAMCVDRYV